MRPLGKNLLLLWALCGTVVSNNLEFEQTDGAGVGEFRFASRAGVARILVALAGLELDAQFAVPNELGADPVNLAVASCLVSELGLLRGPEARSDILQVEAVPLGDGGPGVPGGLAVLDGL